ncbi:MAG TPA: Zn-dependent hydrolase [Bacteroidales bacterium]|nr:Zn-dependent hydrolase [Bacteroidales bacterium]
MVKKLIPAVIFAALIMVTGACDSKKKPASATKNDTAMQQKLDEFATVKLTTDLSKLSVKEKQMIPILIEVAQLMDDIFWEQTLGNKQAFLDSIKDEATRRFAEINYGPWERLGNNAPFISSFGEKPKGANFYPADMTKEEFEKFGDKNKTSQYTLIRRNDDKSLKCVWYHEAYKEKTQKAAALLQKAALLAEDPGLKNYLNLRAQALLTDDYFASDMAWMDMKNNTLDFVVGPIENYEDELFGYKTAHEAALLVKDKDWSLKLAKYSAMLPELQTQLPVDAKYKKEKPGSNSDLNAYDIIYYAGNSNCGGKTIAINLPNDEKVQLKKGSRRLQLKNAMKAKFDNILQPIAKVLCDPSQLNNITFDAFFSNVMFHEVAHGLGIKNTVTGKGTVREALKEKYSAFEEAKADILGLFMVSKLIEKGELKNVTVDDAYVTYMMGIIRSVRFGAGDAHGKANMMCFNFFEDKGAFTRNANGTYKVDIAKTKKAADEWSALILKFEGEGDYAGASKYLETNSIVRPSLKTDIGKLKTAKIPVDIVFEQGVKALGL